MYDRIPSPGKENRVRITQDNGQIVEGVLSYADDATQEGSAYTKGNVLPDDVCTAYGIDTETSEPKDAFLAIPGIMGKCFLLITVKKINGAPYPGVLVNGLTGIDTPRRTTNQNGQVAVYVDAGTYNLTFTTNPVCVDTTIPRKSVTLTAGGTGSVTAQEKSNGLTSLDITSSRSVAFSANVRKLDVFCVGGGGAGGGKRSTGIASAGGGGGRTRTRKSVSFSAYTLYPAVIGAGAVGSYYDGSTGGETSMFGVTAKGGEGGKVMGYPDTTKKAGGNGGSGGGSSTYVNNGAYWQGNRGGSDGSDGLGPGPGKGQGTTTRAFGEPGGALYAGGGASGSNDVRGTPGGDGGGGTGGGQNDAGGDGTPNTGGGGGGVGEGPTGNLKGGNGGSGIIKLRWVNAS